MPYKQASSTANVLRQAACNSWNFPSSLECSSIGGPRRQAHGTRCGGGFLKAGLYDRDSMH